MGYYSRFELDTHDDNVCIDHEDEIGSFVDYIGIFEEDVKWYEWVNDMKKYSLQYPEIMFQVQRTGEENGDIEVGYFKNGKVQLTKAVFTFDPFDENKLV